MSTDNAEYLNIYVVMEIHSRKLPGSGVITS